MFLTENLAELKEALPEVEWEIAVSHVQVNLTRREADLLIRECLPENSSLISRKLGRAAYAVYAAHDYVERFPESRTDARFAACSWVGYDEAHAHFGSQKWLDQRRDRAPETRTNNGVVMVEAVKRGCGLAVLPSYAATGVTGLQRVSPVIPELIVDQWLLVHRDLLRTPRVRAAIDVIVELFKSQEQRLLGG